MTNEATIVWNRAATKHGGELPRAGDAALSALLLAHGLVMNGGVLHAIEGLEASELAAAREGFCFFGFDEVARLFEHAEKGGDDEAAFGKAYSDALPDDGAIMERFFQHFAEHPDLYAPIKG